MGRAALSGAGMTDRQLRIEGVRVMRRVLRTLESFSGSMAAAEAPRRRQQVCSTEAVCL